MSDKNRPAFGSCRCGHVRIEVSAPPVMTAACHCRGCQRMSASAFSLTAMVPMGKFYVAEGDPVKGGIMGPQLDHYFCPDCKTWIFTRITGVDNVVNVRPTMFDKPEWSRPFIETMTSEKLPWAETPALHSFEGFPTPEAFPALLAEFANRR